MKTNLEAAQELVSQLQTDIQAGELESLEAANVELRGKASSAANGTEDLTWRIAELVPFVGENFRAVRMIAESTDDVVQTVASPAIDLASTFDIKSRNPETGGFDLAPLGKANDIVQDAQEVLPKSLDKLHSVDGDSTVAPVSDAVEQLDGLLVTAEEYVAGVAPMLSLAEKALGAESPRNYVLAFQNNAESTALGGSAASFSLLSADNGSIAITDQASSADFTNRDPVDVAVDQSALDLYTDFLITHSNTSTSRPDFPTAGSIISAFWQRDRGVQVDGVISVDPLALSYVLSATGPVTLSTGDELSSDNAVDLLLNEVYFRWNAYDDPEKVDDFFAEASSAILNKVLTGDFDFATMAAAVTKGIDQGSLMAWFTDDEEQAKLDGTRIQGALPQTNAEATVLGVYFRDTSASKMDYYLKTATNTTTDLCSAVDSPTFTTKVSLRSDLTEEQNSDLPDYVRSFALGNAFRTEVFVYGPVGSTLVSASVDVEGEQTDIESSSADLGRPVAKFTVYLKPGDVSSVTASFQGGAEEYGKFEVRGTPMINTTERTLTGGTCE